VEYLRALVRSLRTHVMDPEDRRASAPVTDLATWWPPMAALLKAALPLVSSVTREAGGRVEIESEPGRSTTVMLSLPRNDTAPHETRRSSENGSHTAAVACIVRRLRMQVASSRGQRESGEGEIRTPDRVTPIQHFQCCSFSHSDTSPGCQGRKFRPGEKRPVARSGSGVGCGGQWARYGRASGTGGLAATDWYIGRYR
jgi:hypothetical protein